MLFHSLFFFFCRSHARFMTLWAPKVGPDWAILHPLLCKTECGLHRSCLGTRAWSTSHPFWLGREILILFLLLPLPLLLKKLPETLPCISAERQGSMDLQQKIKIHDNYVREVRAFSLPAISWWKSPFFTRSANSLRNTTRAVMLGSWELLSSTPRKTARKYNEKCLFEFGVLPILPYIAASAMVRESFEVFTVNPRIIAALSLNYSVGKF